MVVGFVGKTLMFLLMREAKVTLKYKKKCCHLKCSLAKVRAEFVVPAFCFIDVFLLSQMVQSQNDIPVIFLKYHTV